MTIYGRSCLLLFYGCFITNLGFISTADKSDDISAMRNKKSFSLFSVVTFKNDECASDSTFAGGAVRGTCYSQTECNDKSGQKSGNCASGFGVCCIFISNVGTATVSENRTYLQSLLFPAVETSVAAITYTINKMQSDICQIRLMFDNFAIAGPTATDEAGGVAASWTNCGDTLTTTLTSSVAGPWSSVPVICGTFTGSHLYLDVGMAAADTATLALAFNTANVAALTAATAFRSWRIRTEQIPCWASYRAPDGCHQYMTGSAIGQIWSPNFATGPSNTQTVGSSNFRRTLMGQDLKYCIRREYGMCCTLFQVCSYDPAGVDMAEVIAGGGLVTNGVQGTISPGWSFHVDCRPGTVGGAAIAADQDVGKVDEDCTGDYIEIPDSTTGFKSYGAAMQVNTRYCCNRFGNVPAITAAAALSHAPVYDCTEPFEVLFHTDIYDDELAAAVVAEDNITIGVDRGFCLIYKQEAC